MFEIVYTQVEEIMTMECNYNMELALVPLNKSNDEVNK